MRLRLALVVLAAWLSVSAVAWLVASSNFRTVDEVLAPGYRSELELRLAPRTLAEERTFFRFLASELNRRYFRWWGHAQLALGVMLAALVLSEPGLGVAAKLTSLGGAVVAACLGLAVTPSMRRLGPPLDFAPRPLSGAWEEARQAFMAIHAAYMALDVLKVLLLLAALVLLLRARERPRFGDMGPGGD